LTLVSNTPLVSLNLAHLFFQWNTRTISVQHQYQ